MEIWFTVILLFAFVLLRFVLKLFTKQLPKWLRKKPIKYLYDINAWVFASVLLITVIVFITPEVWIHNVVNRIIPHPAFSTTYENHDNNAMLDDGAGARGDTFGGAFSPLIGWFAAIITFAAFWIQYKANEQQKKINKSQRKDIQLERFESRFFKFIDFHRQNVNELLYRKPLSLEEECYQGNQVFGAIYFEIRELLEEYIKNKYRGKVLSLDEKKAAINFVYQCVFYGAGKHAEKNLTTKFSCRNFDFIDFKEKKAAYSIDGTHRHVYYTGHVRRLSHYFRNIYQAVTYLEEQEFLNANKKYEYMTIFRAQMSVYEQTVLFFNSISDLGRKWEYQEYEKDMSDVDKEAIYPELCITVYDLIRNTLFEDGEVAEGIFINEFYPLLNLERNEECARSGKLPFKKNDASICRFCFNEKYIKFKNKHVERKIQETLKYRPTEFENFKCDEPDCKTNTLLKMFKEK